MVWEDSLIKPKLMVICGPTASGKSDIAVMLAKRLNGEIISADSMQIYKGMDIGTGKVTDVQRAQVKHYMLDVAEPYQEFSVSDFMSMTEKYVSDITVRGKLPIIAGGTGLYLNMLLSGANLGGTAKNEVLRNSLRVLEIFFSVKVLYELLKNVDSESASRINKNDSKRLIRALEIYNGTGIPKSRAAVTKQDCPYDYKIICLMPQREWLYERINKRVTDMFDNGLEEEVMRLRAYENCASMQAIGYKETIYALNNGLSIDKAIELIQQKSRNYAKRQITYFKNMPFDKEFIDPQDTDAIIKSAEEFINGH